MKIAVLGTGMVGQAIATKLVALGHEVTMGSRSSDNEKATSWAASHGDKAKTATFADAAAWAELAFLCTAGTGSEAVAKAIAAGIDGKVLVDVSNPLDFSKGMPPSLFTARDESLGEIVQKAAPGARVVKTLNTVNCELMVDAGRIPESHTMFLSSDDDDAKATVRTILVEGFGWRHIVDLGPLATARATESYLPLWLALWGAVGSPDFNVAVVTRDEA